MRIVAGSAGGRVLKGPKRADVIRPTSDKVRETIFNVLGQSCEGFSVLDLFAGTGAIALEALSRGAKRAVAVDSGREAQGLCRENAAALGFTSQLELVPQSIAQAIPKLSARGDRFELLFADPPYAEHAVEGLLALLTAHPLHAPNARLIVEHSKHEPAPEQAGPFHRVDQRRFGETLVTIFGLTPDAG